MEICVQLIILMRNFFKKKPPIYIVKSKIETSHIIEDLVDIAARESIDTTRCERGLFATLSLFTRPPVIVTLYDRGESLLAAGEEFQ